MRSPPTSIDSHESQTRRITLDTIRQAAESIYDLVRRTPLVPLESSGGHASPAEVFLKLETPPAYWIVQDSGRLQRGTGPRTGTRAGGRLDRQRGKCRTGRRARGQEGQHPLLGPGHRHRPAHESFRHRAAGGADRQGELRRVLENNRTTRRRPSAGSLRSPIRRRPVHEREWNAWA